MDPSSRIDMHVRDASIDKLREELFKTSPFDLDPFKVSLRINRKL